MDLRFSSAHLALAARAAAVGLALGLGATPVWAQHVITGVASPAAAGSVVCTPNPVPNAAPASCVATANPGYTHSAGFTGCSTVSGSTCLLNAVRSPTTVTAYFSAAHAITASAVPAAGGSVVCTPNPVQTGSSANCEAIPNAGYTLSGFTGCAASGNYCQLRNVTAPASVSANFTLTATSLVPVPALGEWGLALLAMLAAGLGARRMRRQR